MTVGLHDRIAGALAAAALGDALGRVPEQMLTHRRIQRRFGYVRGFVDGHAGHTTDDTEMTRLVLEAVCLGRGRPSADDFACVVRRRLRLHGCLDFFRTRGRTGLFLDPYLSLLKLRLGVPARFAGLGNPLVAADELAMGAAPIGCAHPGDAASALSVAREIGRVMNFGIACEGGAAMACAVALATGGSVSGEAIARETATHIPRLREPILGALEAGLGARADYEDFVRGTLRRVGRVYFIHVAEAVPLALAVAAAYGDSPMDAILRAVNLGRDADTIASMAGAIVGAMHGIDALDGQLLSKVEGKMGFDFRRDATRLMLACGLAGP